MKKRICAMLSMCLLFSAFAGCTSAAPTPSVTKPSEPAADHNAGMEALNGKKIVFFGNSHTYYSHCVVDKGQSTTLTGRTGDQGLFYQICKANGIEVDVTNYSFGVHQLSDFRQARRL